MPFSRNLSRSPFSRTFLQQVDPPSGNGTPASPAANPNPQPQPNNQNPPAPSALERAVADALARNGNNESETIRTLVGQNHRLTQRAETAEAKIGKLPDDVQAELAAYRAYGKPDEIKARLEAGDTAVRANTQRERTDTFRKAAAAAGYDADALLEVIGDVPVVEVKTEKRDGKDVEVAFWQVQEGDKTEAKGFADIVAQRFPKTHEAMKAQQDASTRVQAPVMGVQGAPVNNKYDRIRQEVQNKDKAQSEQKSDLKLAGIY
jgi:uncharacterized protein with PIN domain